MQTADIIREHTATLPIRIGRLARALGVGVGEGSLDPGIAGQIECFHGKYVIRVNRMFALPLQRYVVAHEIAHYILHRELIDGSHRKWIRDDVFFRSPSVPESVEREAHLLGMDLLMPLPLLEAKLGRGSPIDDATTSGLAGLFRVCEQRMKLRLRTIQSRED